MQELRYKIDREKGIAIFEIDIAGPVNTIGEQFIAELGEATEKAKSDRVRGVILTSTKVKSFLDGANLMEIMKDPSPLNVKHIVLKYQETLRALAKSPFPVVAVLVGQTALGGGFEILLWGCDHIFATSGSKLGFPEINVGLFPAAGGPETLRKAMGLKTTLDIILGGRVLPVEFYSHSGLVTMVSKDEIFVEAEKWIENNKGIINRNYDPKWKESNPLSMKEQQTLIRNARERYTVCPEKPYFKAAIDAIEEGLGLPFEEAIRNEVKHFTPLIVEPHVKNKIDLFFSLTSLAPKLATIDRKKAILAPEIAIIGAGLMGQGIAQICADNDIKVALFDVDKQTAQAGREKIGNELELLVKKGRWLPERKERAMNNIRSMGDYGELKNTPLVIEAVFEDLDLKQTILKQVQDVNADIIFASNTSTIPMEEISAHSDRPEQVVGMHYFSPVPLMPLLEVIQGSKTSDTALATAVTSGRQQGKTCIIVGDGPGFYTSRTFGVFVMTGFYLAEMGLDPWEIDRLALEAGFPQGPLHVYGTAGGNVVYHAGLFMKSRIPDLLSVPETLIRMYKAGYTGAGKPCFYKDGLKHDTSALEFVVRTTSFPIPERDEAKEMLLLAMVNQAFLCLDEGVVRDYLSMDIGAILGIGFPDCWHGPARYVSQKGVRAIQRKIQAIYGKYGLSFFKPAKEFERLIACGVDRGLI